MADRRGGATTEKPTPERLREARRLGQVAISGDLTTALGLAAVVVVLAVSAPAGVARLVRYFRAALGHAVASAGFEGAAGEAGGVGTLSSAGGAALAVAVPIVLVPLTVALAAALVFGTLQTGGMFAWSAARPSLGRVSPRAGLRRFFGAATAGAAGRALVKVALVIAVAATELAPFARALPGLVRGTAATILPAFGALGVRLAVRVVVALVAWGIVDWVLARWRHQRDLAMTRDEVKREQREREGEPLRRAERRRVHRELSTQAAPADVRDAAFVVVDVGIAVAVAYHPASGRAPVVVVAGRQAVAQRIERAAREAAVPVHHDGTLAQALVDVPASAEIPDACFEAVAGLLP